MENDRLSSRTKVDDAMLEKVKDKLRSIDFLMKINLSLRSCFVSLNKSGLQTFFLFIGYPRSGHTLIGAMLDAHFNAMCSIEVNVVSLAMRGFTRQQIFQYMHKRNNLFASKFGSKWTNYSYEIPGLSQGKCEQLIAIGDKKGAGTTKQLMADMNLLKRFESKMQLPVKMIHVVRNPFDNLATIALREQQKGLLWNADVFKTKIDAFYKQAQTNEELIKRNAGMVLTVHHEDIVANADKELRKIIAFLNLTATDEYFEKCAEVVNSEVHKTRYKVDWNAELKSQVESMLESIPFFNRYTWDS